MQFSKHMSNLENTSEKDITILINSFGGFTHSGASIITDIMKCSCTVKTVCMGVAYSSAADILLAGDVRAISQFGLIMFHLPAISGAEAEVPINHISNYIKYMSENLEELMNELLKGTKVNKKQFIEKVNNGDWFITPKEAKKLGIIHEIIR